MRSLLFLNGLILWIISKASCCVVETINGYVEGGNITVFTFFYSESFDISLFSQLGDADLYVSNNLHLPTYEPDSYILHSATCGIDTVHIHKRLKRPVYVSVYGHPSYMITVYELSVVPRRSTEEDDINFDLLDVTEDSSTIYYDNISSTEDNEKSAASIQDSREAEHFSENKDHRDPSAFFWFLMNTIIEILF